MNIWLIVIISIIAISLISWAVLNGNSSKPDNFPIINSFQWTEYDSGGIQDGKGSTTIKLDWDVSDERKGYSVKIEQITGNEISQYVTMDILETQNQPRGSKVSGVIYQEYNLNSYPGQSDYPPCEKEGNREIGSYNLRYLAYKLTVTDSKGQSVSETKKVCGTNYLEN